MRNFIETAQEVRTWAFGKETATSICHLCAVKLAHTLRAEGHHAKVILGEFVTDLHGVSGHYWVELEDTIIDISGDQFNDSLNKPHPQIYIAHHSEAVRYISKKTLTEGEEEVIRQVIDSH